MNNIDSFIDSKYYELFINNGSNYPTYWMSSRCVYVFRPCITLNFNVQVTSENGSSDSPFEIK